eukprot:scaffold22131_cov30-Tisochrysis_lutea.AAC.2
MLPRRALSAAGTLPLPLRCTPYPIPPPLPPAVHFLTNPLPCKALAESWQQLIMLRLKSQKLQLHQQAFPMSSDEMAAIEVRLTMRGSQTPGARMAK